MPSTALSRPPTRAGLVAAVAASLSLGALTVPTPAPATAQPPTQTSAGTSARSAATSGTIVFVKDHDVWLVRPDGSDLTRVTRDGTADRPYGSPTMSDNGLIATDRGGQVIVMDQAGTVINTIAPKDLFTRSSGTLLITPIHGPVISPDGRTVTYSQMRSQQYSDRIRIEEATSFAAALPGDQVVSAPVVLGHQPSWVSTSRIVLADRGTIDLQDVDGSEPQPWFHQDHVVVQDDPYGMNWQGVYDPDVSPDLGRVTYTYGSRVVGIGTVTSDPRTTVPAPPTSPTCFLVPDEGTPEGTVFDSPSMGPDGRSIAVEELGNLVVVTSFATCDGDTSIRQIVPGGQEPDWSPAPLLVPPGNGRPTTGTPLPGTPLPGAPGTSGAGQQAFSVKAPPRLGGIPRVGRTLRATLPTFAPKPQRLRIQWLRNGKPIRKATRSRYRLRSADRGKRVSVRVTAVRAGYRTTSVTSRARRVR